MRLRRFDSIRLDRQIACWDEKHNCESTLAIGYETSGSRKAWKKHFGQDFILMLLINVDHESIILIVVDVL